MTAPTPELHGPKPPSAETLGWTLEAFDAEAGRIAVAYEATADFTNPYGTVQGGFLAAMLDDAMGPLVFFMLKGERFPSTQDLHVTYLRPVFPGRVRVEAEITRLGRTTAVTDARLFTRDGKLAAKAMQTAVLVPMGAREAGPTSGDAA